MTDLTLTYEKTMGLAARIRMFARDHWSATRARTDALRIFRPGQDDGPDLDMLLAARARRQSARAAVDRLLRRRSLGNLRAFPSALAGTTPTSKPIDESPVFSCCLRQSGPDVLPANGNGGTPKNRKDQRKYAGQPKAIRKRVRPGSDRLIPVAP